MKSSGFGCSDSLSSNGRATYHTHDATITGNFMNPHQKYWLEAIQSSAEERGVTLTQEQAEGMAEDMDGSHDNIGQAFYTPPSNEGVRREIDELKRAHASEMARMGRDDEALRKTIAARYGGLDSVTVEIRDGQVSVRERR